MTAPAVRPLPDPDGRAQHRRRRELRPPDQGRARLAPVEAARDPAEHRRDAAADDFARAALRQADLHSGAVARKRVAVGGLLDRAALGAVEEELDLVPGRHLDAVLDDEVARFLVEL